MSYAPPLLRLAASPHDIHLLATFSQDSNIIRILDTRQPGQALLELRGHSASVNCIEWSPDRRGALASGADDSLVLIWVSLSHLRCHTIFSWLYIGFRAGALPP
jgi:WD repeat-containing protein 68